MYVSIFLVCCGQESFCYFLEQQVSILSNVSRSPTSWMVMVQLSSNNPSKNEPSKKVEYITVNIHSQNWFLSTKAYDLPIVLMTTTLASYFKMFCKSGNELLLIEITLYNFEQWICLNLVNIPIVPFIRHPPYTVGLIKQSTSIFAVC